MRFILGLWNSPAWQQGRLDEVLEMVKIADRAGIHGFSIPDHIVLSKNIHLYPYAASMPPGTYFYDPLTLLAAVAAVTETIRLTTNIIVLPVRPAVFVAKQVATLDLIARGRLSLGVGVGWQREEYDATNNDWDRRFAYLDEQIRICRELWSKDDVSYRGQVVSFDALTSRPHPLQGERLPIYFGVGPTPRQFRRIAELGDGWLPDPKVSNALDDFRAHVENLREEFAAAGRDGSTIEIGAHLRPAYAKEGDRLADLPATLEKAAVLRDAGATSCYIYPFNYIDSADDYEAVLDALVSF